MINAEINLAIFSLNKISLQYDVVSLDKHYLVVPNLTLDKNLEMIGSVNRLFETVVDLSSDYIKCKLYDANILNEKLILSYFCMIPFGTRLKNSYFLPIKEHENYQTNFSKVIQYF